jgi:cytochrome c biogenesis protein
VKLSTFLTARSTVITLFAAICVALLVASSIPQQESLGGKNPEWVGRLPDGLRFLTTWLKLDHIVGSGWFATLVALFWLSLAISTVSQYSVTCALVKRVPSAALPPESIRIEMLPSDFARLVAGAGYHLVGSVDGVQRYVKNRIGLWGNFLLHVGLVTTVFFSMIYVVTQHRILVRLTGQELTRLTPSNVQELRGVLPMKQQLPYSAVLKNLEPRFWGNDKLEYLSSELYLTDVAGAEPRRVDVALSDKSSYGSYIVYQANAYGRAFDLELETASLERRRTRLFLPYPPKRNVASYGEIGIDGTDFMIKGKFIADAEQASMKLNRSPFTVRLYRGKELLGEATLAPGVKGPLGPLSVTLVQEEWWTDILLDDSRGIAGIFFGFTLILAGVLSSYCLVPREIIVREAAGGASVQHIARRFAPFYREEFDEIIKKLRDER